METSRWLPRFGAHIEWVGKAEKRGERPRLMRHHSQPPLPPVPSGFQLSDNTLTRVLVTLQHHLRITGHGIPELDSAILGTTHNPLPIGRQADTEHKVLRGKEQSSQSPISHQMIRATQHTL